MANVLLVAAGLATHPVAMKMPADAARRQSHEVLLAVPPHLVAVAEALGIPAIAIGEDWTSDPEASDAVPRVLIEQGNEQFNRSLFRHFTWSARSMAEGIMHLAESWRPDVIVHDPSEDGAAMAAEMLGIPSVAFGNGLERLRFTHQPVVRERLNLTRARLEREFQLPLAREPYDVPLSYRHIVTPIHPQLLLGDLPIPGLVGSKREVSPRPGAPRPEEWVAARARGRKLVYVMLGSSGSDWPAWQSAFYKDNEKVIRALSAMPDIEVLVSVGKGNLDKYEAIAVPGNFHIHDWVDQPWVMAQANVALIHVGFGSLGDALAAGTPVVGVPKSIDQPDNAERWYRHGLGPFVTPWRATEEEIRRTTEHVLEHELEYRRRVQAVADASASLASLDDVIIAISDGVAAGDLELRALHALGRQVPPLPAFRPLG